jgi:cell division protein FtsB
MPARSGDLGAPGEKRVVRADRRRSSMAARRRWLILCAVVVLVVVAVLANLGPLTHYQEAKARLQKASANVAGLQSQKADLQGQVAKLTEKSYLETLAREQLTYVRPGEELYIVTGSGAAQGQGTGDQTAAGASSGQAAGGVGAAAVSDVGTLSSGRAAGNSETTQTTVAGADAGETSGQSSPGFLERVLSAVRGWF